MLHVCKQSRKTVTLDWIAIQYSNVSVLIGRNQLWKCIWLAHSHSITVWLSEFLTKGTLYTCFILKVFRLRTQSTVARLTVLMFRNMSWSSMVALCICLRNFTDTVQWKIQEYYAPDKAFKLVFSCHSSVSYLFPLLNVQRMDATEKRLIFGWTLWPASCMVKPWLTTGLTTVARISSEIMALLLALSLHPLPPPPPPPLTLTPLPFWSPLTSMLPSIVLQTRS